MTRADVRILALDRDRTDGTRRLQRWLGPDVAARLPASTDRYLLIITRDTDCRPQRYLHCVMWLPDMEAVVEEITHLLDAIEFSAGPLYQPIDFSFELDPAERDYLNQLLDERQSTQLLHVRQAGNA